MYRYIIRLGFIDGRNGLIYHFLHAWWYRLIVDIFIYRVKSEIKQNGGNVILAIVFCILMLDLSILVCTKNSSQTILSCLYSALPIMKAGAELILVDGHSYDNTVNLVLDFLKTIIFIIISSFHN